MSESFNSIVEQDLFGFLKGSFKPLIVIIGPTASGKTAFAIELATGITSRESKRVMVSEVEPDTFALPACHPSTPLRMTRCSAEIINADSRQLYRFLDIGTGKIRQEEMCGVPHHLLDVLDPKEEATAAWYQKEAYRVIDEIHGRGNLPILVGGSMLYVSAVIDGLSFASPSDPAIRNRLEKEYDKDEGKTLYKRLLEADPETAASFDRRNKPYVIRAMEILETAGKPSLAKTRAKPPYDLFIFGIGIPREELREMIDKRVKQMFKDGWIDEVRALLERGYSEQDPGFMSLGYREIASYLKTGTPSLPEMKKQIITKAQQYAKRQMTWWRRDGRIRWLGFDAHFRFA